MIIFRDYYSGYTTVTGMTDNMETLSTQSLVEEIITNAEANAECSMAKKGMIRY